MPPTPFSAVILRSQPHHHGRHNSEAAAQHDGGRDAEAVDDRTADQRPLEQWRAFITVVDAGGFAQAAEAPHKSQSTISYAVRQIEERLGVPVFEIDGRKAILTNDGGIREELAAGQLKPLPLKEGSERWGAMYLVYPDPDGAGPGARRLGQIIREEAQNLG